MANQQLEQSMVKISPFQRAQLALRVSDDFQFTERGINSLTL
jgi:hypothetical protein